MIGNKELFQILVLFMLLTAPHPLPHAFRIPKMQSNRSEIITFGCRPAGCGSALCFLCPFRAAQTELEARFTREREGCR